MTDVSNWPPLVRVERTPHREVDEPHWDLYVPDDHSDDDCPGLLCGGGSTYAVVPFNEYHIANILWLFKEALENHPEWNSGDWVREVPTNLLQAALHLWADDDYHWDGVLDGNSPWGTLDLRDIADDPDAAEEDPFSTRYDMSGWVLGRYDVEDEG